MFSFIARYPISVSFALLLHALVVVGFAYSSFTTPPKVVKISLDGTKSDPITSNVVKTDQMKTFTVDSALVQKQLAFLRQKEEAKQQNQVRLEKKTDEQKKHLADLKRKQAAEKKRMESARQKTLAEKRKTEEARKKTIIEKRKAEDAKRLANIETQKVDAQKLRATQERKKADKAHLETIAAEKKREDIKLKVVAAEKMRLAAEQERLVEEEKATLASAEVKRINAEKDQIEEERLLAQIQHDEEAEEAELARQLAQEDSVKREVAKQKELKSLSETYVSSIAAKVKDSWKTAARVSDKAECEISITQTEEGRITRAEISHCNKYATKLFKKDAIKAVYRAEPLPAPPIKELFERHIKFVFKP